MIIIINTRYLVNIVQAGSNPWRVYAQDGFYWTHWRSTTAMSFNDAPNPPLYDLLFPRS